MLATGARSVRLAGSVLPDFRMAGSPLHGAPCPTLERTASLGSRLNRRATAHEAHPAGQQWPQRPSSERMASMTAL